MLRHATEEELRMIKNMPELLRVLEDDFLTKAKLGFIDMTVGADDALDRELQEKSSIPGPGAYEIPGIADKSTARA